MTPLEEQQEFSRLLVDALMFDALARSQILARLKSLLVELDFEGIAKAIFDDPGLRNDVYEAVAAEVATNEDLTASLGVFIGRAIVVRDSGAVEPQSSLPSKLHEWIETAESRLASRLEQSQLLAGLVAEKVLPGCVTDKTSGQEVLESLSMDLADSPQLLANLTQRLAAELQPRVVQALVADEEFLDSLAEHVSTKVIQRVFQVLGDRLIK